MSNWVPPPSNPGSGGGGHHHHHVPSSPTYGRRLRQLSSEEGEIGEEEGEIQLPSTAGGTHLAYPNPLPEPNTATLPLEFSSSTNIVPPPSMPIHTTHTTSGADVTMMMTHSSQPPLHSSSTRPGPLPPLGEGANAGPYFGSHPSSHGTGGSGNSNTHSNFPNRSFGGGGGGPPGGPGGPAQRRNTWGPRTGRGGGGGGGNHPFRPGRGSSHRQSSFSGPPNTGKGGGGSSRSQSFATLPPSHRAPGVSGGPNSLPAPPLAATTSGGQLPPPPLAQPPQVPPPLPGIPAAAPSRPTDPRFRGHDPGGPPRPLVAADPTSASSSWSNYPPSTSAVTESQVVGGGGGPQQHLLSSTLPPPQRALSSGGGGGGAILGQPPLAGPNVYTAEATGMMADGLDPSAMGGGRMASYSSLAEPGRSHHHPFQEPPPSDGSHVAGSFPPPRPPPRGEIFRGLDEPPGEMPFRPRHEAFRHHAHHAVPPPPQHFDGGGGGDYAGGPTANEMALLPNHAGGEGPANLPPAPPFGGGGSLTSRSLMGMNDSFRGSDGGSSDYSGPEGSGVGGFSTGRGGLARSDSFRGIDPIDLAPSAASSMMMDPSFTNRPPGRPMNDNMYRGGPTTLDASGGPSVDFVPDGPPFRESFRAGPRRGSDMSSSQYRGGGGGDQSYYGPAAAAAASGNNAGSDFRRSPHQRGRPIFGGAGRGHMSRQTSFNNRRNNNNDPRFSGKGDPGALPEMIRSSFDDGEGKGAGFVPGPDRPYFRNLPKGADSAADPFGRTRDWSRTSPQVSPQFRKTMVGNFPHGFSDRPNLPFGRDDTGRETTHETETDQEQAGLTAVEEQEENLLHTSALGEAHVERADKVISLLSELLDDASLKGEKDSAYVLPGKKVLLKAMTVIEGKIREAQKKSDELQVERDEAVRVELEQEQAKALALETAKQEEEERKRLENSRRLEEEERMEEEIQTLRTKRTHELQEIEEQAMHELEKQLATNRSAKEEKLLADIREEISALQASFEKERSKVQDELNQSMDALSSTEKEIALIEARADTRPIASETLHSATGPHLAGDLVTKILAENRSRASLAAMEIFSVSLDEQTPSDSADLGHLEVVTDPKENVAMSEWARRAAAVSGLADSLYSDPSQAPFYEHNEKVHEMIGPIIKEYVRASHQRLNNELTELSVEYEVRREEYDKRVKGRTAKGKQKRSVSIVRHQTIMGASRPILESSSNRSSNNPYRRARRGNEVRSEYEQEQIIAELAAKEALEKKIMHGGCKLPRQRGKLENKLFASFTNTFNSHRVDVVGQEDDLRFSNVWSDMEKCIFLDRFLQHPKDFRKIASFLRNKSTKDCVAFYYDSKKAVPYKGALREHIMRRKRRGDYHVWDATIQAAISVGASVEAGCSEDKPLVFLLPQDEHTYYTAGFHPMRLELFDSMKVDESMTEGVDLNSDDEGSKKPAKSSKRQGDELFQLDPRQAKFLRASSPETTLPTKNTQTKPAGQDTEATEPISGENTREESGGITPIRKAPQKWNSLEKKIFIETLEKHGRNWAVLSQAVGTKSISQIKNYYYDYKKQAGRERKVAKPEPAGKSKKREEEVATPPLEQVQPMQETATEPPQGDDVSSIALTNDEDDDDDKKLVSQVQPAPQQHLQQSYHEHSVQQQQVQHLQQEPHLSLSTSQAHHAGISSGSVDIYSSHVRQLELDRSMPHSGATTPDVIAAAELWAQAQQQALLHQHSQNQLSAEEAARRILQHHSQSHHPQVLSNLLPAWMASAVVGRGNAYDGWSETQQLQSLLQLQRHQQQQQQHQQHSHNNSLAASLGNSSQLRTMALANLAGLNPAALAGLSQLDQPAEDSSQLALVQRLLAYQARQNHHQSGLDGVASAADALQFLAHAARRNAGPGGNNGH